MEIRLVEDNDGFLALKNDWNRLAKDLIPINDFDWMYKWWKYNSDGNELKIVVAEKDTKILGIAPLYIQNTKAFKFVPVKKLCLLGGQVSDYLDFIIPQTSKRESVFEALLNYIFNNIKVDEISFSQINSDYKNFDLWKKYTSVKNLDFQPYRECHRIDFSKYNSFEEYFNQLSKSHKRSIKARMTKVNKELDSHEFVFKREITESDIDTIAQINIKRQKFLYEAKDRKQRFCYFTDRQKADFIKDYFSNADLKDKFVAYLKCNEQIASYILILTDEKSMYLWNMAFDCDFEFCAPTKVLINELIKYAFENNYRYFDFMRGNDPYKIKWTNDITFCHSFFKPLSPKAKLINICRNYKPDFVTKMFNKSNISFDSC